MIDSNMFADLPFYMFDKQKFISNISKLNNAFNKYYNKFQICYSYKTNYMPAIAKTAYESNAFAEIVSDMEGYVARKIGVPWENIIYNGPAKSNFEEYLKNGSIIVVDNAEEADAVYSFAKEYSDVICHVGFRLNYELRPNKISRFGFDVLDDSLKDIIDKFGDIDNISIDGMHCHIGGARNLDDWVKRAETMLYLSDKLFEDKKIKFIDLGSGMFGEMEDELAVQFSDSIPTFEDYAREIGSLFTNKFGHLNYNDRPYLYVEPGTTIVANTVNFYAKVMAIKNIRGKEFAILNCSSHNIGVLSTKKNLPITVVEARSEHANVDFVGYTCIEADCFYRNYSGKLDVGSVVEFRNVGSYSINMKPPFIMPNCAVIEYNSVNNEYKIVKNKESYEDVFATYKW